MTKHGLYLVCKEHINEVKEFLNLFFEEVIDKHSHDKWITFRTPENFLINLMEGKEQSITQNISFEIYCQSMEELNDYAQKHNAKIENFIATESSVKYKYHYIEVLGPKDICKLEISYSEDL